MQEFGVIEFLLVEAAIISSLEMVLGVLADSNFVEL